MNPPTATETFEMRDELWQMASAIRSYRLHFGADTATAAKLDHLEGAINSVTTELSMVARAAGHTEKHVKLIGNLPDEWVPETQMDAFINRADELGVRADITNGGPGGIDFVLRGRTQQVDMLLLSDHVEASA